jgi:Flp pilus assembly protein TadD
VTGRALLAVGRNVEAIGKLADAADQDPEHVGFALDLGDAVLRVGLNEQALVIARRAIELDPQSVDAFLLLPPRRKHSERG